jgi:NADH:ubiquinone oxidoreductase subunit E
LAGASAVARAGGVTVRWFCRLKPGRSFAMPEIPAASITICMGSSCFSRGNSRNIEVVQDFLKTQSLPPSVELNGHLCEGHCKSGPNVTINGKMYHEVDPIVIVGLLNHFVPKTKP